MNFFEYIEQHKFSILITIGIHIVIFVWLNLQLVVSVPYVANESVVMQLDFSDEQEEELDEIEENQETGENNNTQLTNIVANASQEKTTYTNQSFSKAKADQEVLDELKRLESEEYNSIEHPEEENKEDKIKDKETINKNLVKEDAKENDNASYGNDVKATANYYLPDRKPQRKPTPSYKCTTQGIVTVIIKVNQKGSVVSTAIDESKTNTDSECLRSEAITYAERWKFTQNFNDEAKKEGWIKFTYASQ